MNFLGFPEIIPDSTTIWLFRERLKEKGKIDAIWQALQRQLDARGSVVKEGSIEVTKPELAAVKMELGLRKATSTTLGLSSITR
jgi:IS5 family transposase